ncbi:MAG: DUF2069 domain-containing protein [Halieaceae bacterium]|jgi:uncharacterized membrane protein|nr:DUF2069 domain-containing protein [Halieaceae bacterium]
MSDTGKPVPRGTASTWLWLALWTSFLTLGVTMAIDGVGRSVPVVVWLLWYLPIAVFIPGMLRDRLRSMAWLSFVTLMYFVAAVQRIFAEPGSARAQLELLAVIALFLATMFYVRMRGPELRAARDEVGEGDGTDPAAITQQEIS